MEATTTTTESPRTYQKATLRSRVKFVESVPEVQFGRKAVIEDDFSRVCRTLRARPGTWAVVADKASAHIASRFNRIDGFEAVARNGQRTNGYARERYTIYARFVGDES